MHLLQQPVDDADRVCILHSARVRTSIERAAETQRALKFIDDYQHALERFPYAATATDTPRIRAWQAFCQALMASNEFVYVN